MNDVCTGSIVIVDEIRSRRGRPYDADVVDTCRRLFNEGYQLPASLVS